MDEVILMPDPAATAIPVHECGERLVDVRSMAELAIDTRKEDATGAFAHLREGVLNRLMKAQRLLPQGLRLLLVEGYRPLALRRHYFGEDFAQTGGRASGMVEGTGLVGGADGHG